mgnify:CR=1 FL=1
MARQEASEQMGVTRESLLEVAKQAIADLCEIKLEEVSVSEQGVIDFGSHGASTAVFFWPDDEPLSYAFRATLLQDIEESPLVYELINHLNKDIVIGQVFYDKGEIVLFYRLLVDQPTPDTVVSALEYLQEVADDYDDRLKLRLGGKRFIEISEDEIEV